LKALFYKLVTLIGHALVVLGVLLLFFRTSPQLSEENPCLIKGYETVLCVKAEDNDFTYWKVVGVAHGRVVVIERKDKKPLFHNLPHKET
jgi:hypothetical protein